MRQEDLIKEMNKYREENKIFHKSVSQRSDKMQSIMYDWPPFASGNPHFGHWLTSTMKDSICRFKTMKWYKVVRNRWRDTHGLPVEKYVEKLLNIDGKKDIEKMWIEKFVEACRETVKNTSDEWVWFINSLGRRADMDHAYFTMDLWFMESVLWIFQNMYNKNLVYKWFKIQWYCPSCATWLSNSEINDWYKDKQDPAISIKLQVYDDFSNKEFETTSDGSRKTIKAIIKNNDEAVLAIQTKVWHFILPGWWVDLWENDTNTLSRELKEEIWVDTKSEKYIGMFKKYRISSKRLISSCFYEVEIEWTPKIIEKDHVSLAWVKKLNSDNEFWFALQIEDNIIDDPQEIMDNFHDIYLYYKEVHLYMDSNIPQPQDCPIYALARTTTPRTLPANMYLAVGKFIKYVQIFDKQEKEYYILWFDLLSKYYKDKEDYILIRTFNWEHLEWLHYYPIFDYISKSKIDKQYQDNMFKIILADFVSTEAWTGIVHQAPAFWEDDFNAVAQILPREKSLDRLFLPVDEYGEFTDEVSDYQWIRVYDANKQIIKRLKDENKLIAQQTISHSYPHCRRCDTPLIYKAIDSRFIKEQDIAKKSIANMEDINFVPVSVKNRFRDTLKSAPDRNVSRNRYRWAPIPIRLPVWSEDEKDAIVIWNLDELYQQTTTGSKNINKHVIIRHARTDYNDLWTQDSYWKAILTDDWQKQADNLINHLTDFANLDENKEVIIMLSPLARTLQTLMPYLKTKYKTDIDNIEQKYQEITKKYKKLREEWKLIKYILDESTKKQFEITKDIFVDFRLTDTIMSEYQDKRFSCKELLDVPTNTKLSSTWESVDMMEDRIRSYFSEINKTHIAKTIVTVTHEDLVILIHKQFEQFDFKEKREEYDSHNAEVRCLYRDNKRNAQVDLHKPYVDSYRFKSNWKTYKRIPEVLDCRFESGSMPYWQVNYIWDKKRDSKVKSIHLAWKDKSADSFQYFKQFPYPTDFIIEWLDQTRGWFRTLHILGNWIMNKNAYNNVLVNWLVLAEDWKKMSKKLKNYPDPKELFYKYGSDAYRLYLLSSPGVRAEPVRFIERGVEQIYKDFSTALSNAFNFFSTYAKVDKFKNKNTKVRLMRHAEAESKEFEAKLTDKWVENMKNPFFIENILRTAPDVIYHTKFIRSKKTAEVIANIISKYNKKEVELKEVHVQGKESESKEIIKIYEKIISDHAGENVLIVAHDFTFNVIREKIYIWNENEFNAQWYKRQLWIKNLEIVKLPIYNITNELDKRILAELNKLIFDIESNMDKYILDVASKKLLEFIDKLNNRFIRRSRRRFRASGMSKDKISAYNTLFEVFETYTRLCAPFAPFISEKLRLDLQKFTEDNSSSEKDASKSVHLQFFPIASKKYIDEKLLEDIELVRRMIWLWLFIRSKNNIRIKQPLQKMEFQIE